MRNLVVNSSYPPLTTGSTHFSHDVATQNRAAGHEVTVITAQPAGAPRREVVDGIDVRRVSARWIQPGNLSFDYWIPFSLLDGWRSMRRTADHRVERESFRPPHEVLHSLSIRTSP